MCSVVPCTGQRQMRRAMSLCDSAESLHRLASSGKAVHSVPKLRKAPRDRRAVTRSAAASPSARSPPAERWSTFTTQLVATSTLPFLLLLWPQLIKNARNLQSNPEALGGLSWLVSLHRKGIYMQPTMQGPVLVSYAHYPSLPITAHQT